MRVRRASLCAAALLLAAAPWIESAPAIAESSLAFSPPPVLGHVAADTFDESGRRIGSADLLSLRLSSGHYLLRVETQIEGDARADLRAELAPIDGSSELRLVSERSESKDAQGRSLGVTAIDHRARVATCLPATGSDQAPIRIDLPSNDRVVNVPLNLLFGPLVTGEVESIEFQVLVCSSGGRLIDARAQVARSLLSDTGQIVEVRYDLDFGPIMSRLAAPFLPRLSLWFDGSEAPDWVAHRVPLFSKGPTVLVIRSGFAPSVLGAAE